jgi:hypothetical protein
MCVRTAKIGQELEETSGARAREKSAGDQEIQRAVAALLAIGVPPPWACCTPCRFRERPKQRPLNAKPPAGDRAHFNSSGRQH